MRRLVLVTTLYVLAIGQAAAACDPHYRSDVCVPIASDVDCWPGEGDGPVYVEGPFEYEGDDIYGLDRNKDGVACEPAPRR
ncbi:MAG: hypothetical protein ABL962_08025 [Fimbriimonadaceae bacterium]